MLEHPRHDGLDEKVERHHIPLPGYSETRRSVPMPYRSALGNMLYAADLRKEQDGRVPLYGSGEAGELYDADTEECGAGAGGDILRRL